MASALLIVTCCDKQPESELDRTYDRLYSLAVESNDALVDYCRTAVPLAMSGELVLDNQHSNGGELPEWSKKYFKDWEKIDVLEEWDYERELMELAKDSDLTDDQKDVIAVAFSSRIYVTRFAQTLMNYRPAGTKSSFSSSFTDDFELNDAFFNRLYINKKSYTKIGVWDFADTVEFVDDAADTLAIDSPCDSLQAKWDLCAQECKETLIFNLACKTGVILLAGVGGALTGGITAGVLGAAFETTIKAALISFLATIGISASQVCRLPSKSEQFCHPILNS